MDQLPLILWLPQLPGEPVGFSLEDCLSRAIEASEEDALSLLRTWKAKYMLTHLGTDSRGMTGVQVAVVFKRYRTLLALLNSKAVDVNQPSTNAAKKGWTALHFAAFLMDLRAIEILLSFNCDTSLVTTLGSTPLHFVTGRFGNRGDHLQQYVKTIMNILVTAGVNPTATNKYGYTFLHESIMWNDVTSLSVIISSKHFNQLLLMGTTLLPHELGWRSTLPDSFKTFLEKHYFAQKMLTPKFTTHDFHVYEILECVSRPSPPTVQRLGFQHPESLTECQVGSLVQSAPPKLVIEALKYQQSIREYYHCSFREYRYVFPAYFPASLPDWVCGDCRDCRIVAGRWLEIATENAAKNFLVRLMMAVLSKASFSQSTSVSSGAYFRTASKIQLGIQCVDRVRSIGIMIHVCSGRISTPEITRECRGVLNLVVQLAFDLEGENGSVSCPVAVVSSRDLRAGKKIPHLFTSSEVREARMSNKSFLSNPACLNKAETFLDLLLLGPETLKEADECDSADCVTSSSVQNTTYYQPDEWMQEVYVKAVKDHAEDIARLVDADLVADYLVSDGIFSLADRDDVSTANDKVSCLLEKIQSKNAYRSSFSILLQTGAELPAHERLFDILNDTCKEIDSTGSLHNWYLEGHMAAHLEQPPKDSTATTPTGNPVRPCTGQSGRNTDESGYGTHNSVQSQAQLTSASPKQPALLDVDIDSHLSMENNSFHSSVASPVHLSDGCEDDDFCERRDVATNVTKSSSVSRRNSTSAPIAIPKRSSLPSSSSTHHPEQAASAARASVLSSPSDCKRLSGGRKSTNSSPQQQVSRSGSCDRSTPPQLSVKDVALDSCVYESADYVDDSTDDDHRETMCDSAISSTPFTVSRRSSFTTTLPISIPKCSLPSSSSCVSNTEREAGVDERIGSSSSSTPKHLSSTTSFFRRLMDAVFASDGGNDSFNVLPGVKQMF